MANKMVIRTTSNMKKLIREVHNGLEEKVEDWMHTGEDAAKSTLAKRESQRGYALNTLYDSISSEKRGELNAAIVVAAWYAHFFEYGTRFIAPMPFLRPGKAKADKEFRTQVKRELEQRAARARVL